MLHNYPSWLSLCLNLKTHGENSQELSWCDLWTKQNCKDNRSKLENSCVQRKNKKNANKQHASSVNNSNTPRSSSENMPSTSITCREWQPLAIGNLFLERDYHHWKLSCLFVYSRLNLQTFNPQHRKKNLWSGQVEFFGCKIDTIMVQS